MKAIIFLWKAMKPYKVSATQKGTNLCSFKESINQKALLNTTNIWTWSKKQWTQTIQSTSKQLGSNTRFCAFTLGRPKLCYLWSSVSEVEGGDLLGASHVLQLLLVMPEVCLANVFSRGKVKDDIWFGKLCLVQTDPDTCMFVASFAPIASTGTACHQIVSCLC